MAVTNPVQTHKMMERPTEPTFSRTPSGLTKIPDPIIFPE